MKKEIIQKTINKTNSMLSASKLLDINYKTFRKYAKKYGLWNPNQCLKGGLKPKIKLENVLQNKVCMKSSVLKKRLLDEKYLKYVCIKCKNNGEWMGEKITLELDHIDGNSENNKLDNLRILCPNCHSQTPTFRGRKNRKIKKVNDEKFKKIVEECKNISEICNKLNIVSKGGNYKTIKNRMDRLNIQFNHIKTKVSNLEEIFNEDELKCIKKYHLNRRGNSEQDRICKCGEKKTYKSKECKSCRNISSRKYKRPTYEILLKDIEILGYTGSGKKYNVSDNTIRKWKKYYENI